MGNIFKKISLIECRCCPKKRNSSYNLILNDFYQVNELDTVLYKSDDDIISGETLALIQAFTSSMLAQ